MHVTDRGRLGASPTRRFSSDELLDQGVPLGLTQVPSAIPRDFQYLLVVLQQGGAMTDTHEAAGSCSQLQISSFSSSRALVASSSTA